MKLPAEILKLFSSSTFISCCCNCCKDNETSCGGFETFVFVNIRQQLQLYHTRWEAQSQPNQWLHQGICIINICSIFHSTSVSKIFWVQASRQASVYQFDYNLFGDVKKYQQNLLPFTMLKITENKHRLVPQPKKRNFCGDKNKKILNKIFVTIKK